MTGIPPWQWPLSDDAGKATEPWYLYFKAADDTWRVRVTNLTSLSTVSTPTADLIANSGITLMESVPATTRTLADPVPGCRKTLCVVDASTTGKVTLQSTNKFFRPGSGWKLAFTSSSAHKTVMLEGISTFEYLIVSNPGGVTVTTT